MAIQSDRSISRGTREQGSRETNERIPLSDKDFVIQLPSTKVEYLGR